MTIGIDIASVDGLGDPTWQACRQQGHLRFVGLRAAYGAQPDSTYKRYAQQLDAIGVPYFGYLFIRWNIGTPLQQAQALLATCGQMNPRYFCPAIDVEGNRNGLSSSQCLDWIRTIVAIIKSSLGVAPLLYSSAVYWADPAGINGLPADDLGKECLGWWKYWPYPTRSPAVYDPAVVDSLKIPPAPAPWKGQCTIHQYQGDALGYPGLSGTCDMDKIIVVKEGDTGGNVLAIQRRVGAIPDGVYGPATKSKVQAFQTAHRVLADGIVGLDTWQLLSWVPPAS